MKKNLWAIAVGAAFVLPGAAFADVKVYGKFNVGLDRQKDEIGLSSINANALPSNKGTWSFHDQTNSSRVGVKGGDDLGVGDLKGIYQVELGINPDGNECNSVVTGVNSTSSGGNVTAVTTTTSCQERVLTQRNTFVGLTGGFGTVKVGKFDTPVKVAGEKIDQFNDEGIGDDTGLLVGETRQNNMIQYTSPKIADALEINLAVVPGEGRTSPDDTASNDKGLADNYYASLVFHSDMFYGSVSYAGKEAGSLKFDKNSTSGTAAYDVIRAAALVKPIVDLELGALYQQAKGIDQKGSTANANGSDAKETSYLLSLGYSIEAFKLKAEYGQTKGEITDAKRNLMAFGVDYKLSKAFTTQFYYIDYKDKDRIVNGITDPKSTAYGMGVIYNF